MAIYRLNDDQQQELLGQPEYGMGYQLAHDRTYVFLNAEIAIDMHPQVSPDHLYPDGLGLIAGEDVGLLTDLLQKGAETFWRYSAFRHDRRILPDGSVSPGTYVTTQNDSALVTSGLGAVGRYALPNPLPARFASVLKPAAVMPIRCGNSAPLFGQAGGGVEILFTHGLPAGSLANHLMIDER